LEEKHYQEALYISKNNRIYSLYWPDIYTLSCMVISSVDDPSNPSHGHYHVHLSLLGWGTCECPSFHKGTRACKHLYAVRYLIPSLNCPYSFCFPSTRQEAFQIYSSLFPTRPDGDPSSLPPPPPPPVKSKDVINVLWASDIIQHIGIEQTGDNIEGQTIPSDDEGENSGLDTITPIISDYPVHVTFISPSLIHIHICTISDL
jgi:hypothetical protein